ncbi:MAG: hypothetical protein ACYDH6_05615 [Acidimicrobiales bacterium]
MTGRRAQVPWGVSDARTIFFTTLGGFGALFVSWWGASGTARPNRQVTWIVVGIVAIVVIGVGNFFWLLAGRRAVGARQASVLGAIADAPRAVRPATPGASLVAVDGSTRSHLPSCLLVRAKAVTAIDHPDPSLRPCEMCQP